MILVCFALRNEARPFARRAPRRAGVEILTSGVGADNAERAVRRRLGGQPLPRWVLTCGFAGGLNPAFAPGAVLFEAGAGFPLRDRLLSLGGQPAKFHQSGRILATAAEKQECRRQTGADAVEMESRSIHAVCGEFSIPCATVRVVSDAADEDMPLDFNRFLDVRLRLSYARLLWHVAPRPALIPELLRFNRQTLGAARGLADFLALLVADAPA
jgi:adenosylhomocysteine nucleosidase